MNSPLDRLAERHGIMPGYHTIDGQAVLVPDETKVWLLAALGVDAGSPEAIEEALAQGEQDELPVLAPAADCRCFLPAWLEEGKGWGISLMLYELRSARNWGIGDLADLEAFCRIAAAAGADFVGLNPLHALFLAAPGHCSPFSPSNRRFLNPLIVAPDLLPGAEPTEGERAEIARLRESALVDYSGVAAVKLAALSRAFAAWRAAPPAAGNLSDEAFERFRREGGEALGRHALFEALSFTMVANGTSAGFFGWPAEFRDAGSEAVRNFAEAHADAVLFHLWLQWVAAVQLADAAEAAAQAGMRIGLYLDFAVGEVPDGSAVWSRPELSVRGVSIGAPPDMFTADGQYWGLVPPNPAAMKREGLASFGQLLERLSAPAGALRLDHAMALWQLFLVPEGRHASAGGYLRYPIAKLLERLSRTSCTHGTIMIGEDLGIVPPGFREVMAASNILSYRILVFEQRDGTFLGLADYPRLALACLSTHDLPTWIGWWQGSDVGLRLETALIDEGAAHRQWQDRDRERRAMVELFAREGMLAGGELDEAWTALGDPLGPLPPSLVVAAHRFIARSASLLAGVRLADLVGEPGQTNLPGTVDSFPNWRPKLSVPVEEMAAQPLFRLVTEAMAAERPRRL